MNKTHFAVGDAHGCYTALKTALDEAGFLVGEPNHVLIALGDMFDRGTEQLEMYTFLRDLDDRGQLIYILGNHDLMLTNLRADVAGAVFHYRHNGLKQTIHQIFGVQKYEGIQNYLKTVSRTEKFRQMVGWLRTKKLYFETEDYVFTHAGIPITPNWRDVINEDDTWMKTWQMFDDRVPEAVNNKILVCGHWHAFRLREYYGSVDGSVTDFDNIEHHKPFTAPHGHFIGIDGCTNHTGLVNVLVVSQPEPQKPNF